MLSPQAELYRQLVDRLERIQEAEGTTTQGPDTTVPDLDYGSKTSNSTDIPTIEAGSFKEAYAKAVKMGVKKFRWCGTYAVKAAVPNTPQIKAQPAPYVASSPAPKARNKDEYDMVPGTYNPDINTGGYTATYRPRS